MNNNEGVKEVTMTDRRQKESVVWPVCVCVSGCVTKGETLVNAAQYSISGASCPMYASQEALFNLIRATKAPTC